MTSRGRDPGIMDRPDAQDYHTQIYPVLPGQYLRVVVDLVQQLPIGGQGIATFTLPLEQSSEVTSAAQVHARVDCVGIDTERIVANFPDYTTRSSSKTAATLALDGDWLPASDWTIRISPDIAGGGGEWVRPAVFSRMARSGGIGGRLRGAFAASIFSPCGLVRPRLLTRSRSGVSLDLPTEYSEVNAGDALQFTGRYERPGPVSVIILSQYHAPIHLRIRLGAKSCRDAENPAAKLWADKRIAALQDSPRDRKREVVGLSRRYTVVSSFTALLAIPVEELARYRRLMATRLVHTNTDAIGGGGGDPVISVDAPKNARQVVAVFPDGSAKNLDYDADRRSWITRFDYPFGTPGGEYDVTIIVVGADGNRTRLILTYYNLLAAPGVKALASAGGADMGAVRVEVSGEAIAKATVVAPWGEREPMAKVAGASTGHWLGMVNAPRNWPRGPVSLTVVCYDGAHNRSEVSVDVDLER